MKQTDTETQLKILAFIARGDTYDSISKELNIPPATISSIKKRNESALDMIKGKLVEHQISNSRKILDKSHQLIERKLDKALTADQERQELLKALDDKEITVDEFQARISTLERVTLTELNATSREAFNQSQIEAGKPTSISSPAEAKQQLTDLVEALKDGNEVELFKMVLSPNRDVIQGETL